MTRTRQRPRYGRGSTTLAVVLLAAVVLAGEVRAQEGPPAAGKFLVATRDLSDPNFARTVVLLLQYDEAGAMGVVINRPTEVGLSELLPSLEGFEDDPPRVFEGGPVERYALTVLVGSAGEEGAQRVLEGVYVSRSLSTLRRVAGSSGRTPFRVYAGYAGWAPGQLDHELERGGWHVRTADAASVFEEAPARIWMRLVPPDPVLRARATPSQR